MYLNTHYLSPFTNIQVPSFIYRREKMDSNEFFAATGSTEAQRYKLTEVIGKGSYGVVAAAVDQYTGEKVAIKKITNVFDHVSDATRILREIKLLRLLRHPDIVEIKHIMLPPSSTDFKDIYVVFELMETDLHQVIKANDDLTPEHHQFFLYQMLRGLKYIHSAKVFHRDLKPKNILANSDCKLKVCDFGLARPAFNDMPTTVFWTDYVATRWYRAPELCGSFYAKYTPAIDIWSIGCIFAEILKGKPLFPGRNVVHQLELITDLLGTPTPDVINKVRNEKARRFLANMRKKPGIPFEQYFPGADPGALRLLRRLLAFDPAERPTAEEALADPYFAGLSQPSREPASQPVSKVAFEFERRKLNTEEVRELIYRESLEYHPQMLAEYLSGRQPNFVYPSAVDNFKRQFAHLEAGGQGQHHALGQATSLPRERVREFQSEAAKYATAYQRGMSGVSAASAYPQQQQQQPLVPGYPTGYPSVPPPPQSQAASVGGGGTNGSGMPHHHHQQQQHYQQYHQHAMVNNYSNSNSNDRVVEMLGSSVEKMSMIDAAAGYQTTVGGYLQPAASGGGNGGAAAMQAQYHPHYHPAAASKQHLTGAAGIYGSNPLLRSNSVV